MAIIREISKPSMPVNPIIEVLEAKAVKDWQRVKAAHLKKQKIKQSQTDQSHPVTAETATEVHWVMLDILKAMIGLDESVTFSIDKNTK